MKKFDLESYIKGLSPELQEKARACTSVEELLKLADENNIELSADQLEAVTGGSAYTAGTPAWNYHITILRIASMQDRGDPYRRKSEKRRGVRLGRRVSCQIPLQ